MTRLFLRWWLLWLAMSVLLSTGCARSKCQTCPGLTLEFQDPNLEPPKNVQQDIFQVTLQSIGFDWLILESELVKQDNNQRCYKLALEKDNASVCLVDPIPIKAGETNAYRATRVAVRFTLTKQESQNVRNSQNISVELLGRASDSLQVFDPKKKTAVFMPRKGMKFSLSGKWLVVQDDKESCIAQFTSKSLASQEHTFDQSTVKITWTKGCN